MPHCGYAQSKIWGGEMIFKQQSKYGNTKCKSMDGEQFDSIKERNRYYELRLLQNMGKISDLRLQVPYELIPGAKEEIPTGEIYIRGPKKGQPKMKTVTIEQPVVYVADFVYTEDGCTVVEDAKGKRTEAYIIKRKLLLYIHGIRIKEV